MIDIDVWMTHFTEGLLQRFGDRVWFIGLQGSYAREEATEQSDIDVVVILDKLSVSDIEAYDELLDAQPHRNLLCGFLSGREEITKWEPADLFQFYHDTRPVKGSLDALLVLIDEKAVNRAIKTGLCNLYHACVHNMLHDKSEGILMGLYKSSSFVIQAIAYRESGRYWRKQSDLLNAVLPQERKILENFYRIKSSKRTDFRRDSEELFGWLQQWILKVD